MESIQSIRAAEDASLENVVDWGAVNITTAVILLQAGVSMDHIIKVHNQLSSEQTLEGWGAAIQPLRQQLDEGLATLQTTISAVERREQQVEGRETAVGEREQ